VARFNNLKKAEVVFLGGFLFSRRVGLVVSPVRTSIFHFALLEVLSHCIACIVIRYLPLSV